MVGLSDGITLFERNSNTTKIETLYLSGTRLIDCCSKEILIQQRLKLTLP